MVFERSVTTKTIASKLIRITGDMEVVDGNCEDKDGSADVGRQKGKEDRLFDLQMMAFSPSGTLIISLNTY